VTGKRSGILDFRMGVSIFVLGAVLIVGVLLLLENRADSTGAKVPTRVVQVVTPSPTTKPGTPTPPSPSATPRVRGPVVTSQNWTPSALGWGDTVRISMRYKTDDAPLTEVVLHEEGLTATGEPIRWGNIKGPNNIDFLWSEDNVLHAPFTAPANTDDTFSLSLNCPFQTAFTSALHISFVDVSGRSSPDVDPIVVTCTQTGE
jgi:hypothetical protein